MRKLLLGLFFSIISLFGFNSVVLAQQEQIEAEQAFENSLKSTYNVQENGSTYVEHTFTIKNLTPTYYITKHGLRTSSTSISGVRVMENGKNLDPEVTQVDNQTNIGITFPDKLVGEGKTRTFTISYTNPDLAQANGSVLEVAVPKQADPHKYAHIEVVLNTPIRFGSATRVTPATNYVQKLTEKGVQMVFGDLGDQGVSALFGYEQIYDLNFTYFLENNNSQPILLQTALPPDTPFQRMNYSSIEPEPTEMKLDKDGNWIATFYMQGNTAQAVKVKAQALLTLEQNPLVPIAYPQAFNLAKQPFWETDNADLQKIAAEHPSPKEVYDFVTSQLEYAQIDSIDNLERKGAIKALEKPDQAACQEFSDLFVTLARINKIPARVITGYGYAENSRLRPLSLGNDILHAWPEYWNEEKQNWQPIDPTWENTTGGVDYFNHFDLNHIVLAINGESSTLPYPAGSYKTDKQQKEKTLEVNFGKSFPEQEPNFEVTLEPQKNTWIGMPGFYDLKIKNKSGAAWYNLNFDLASNNSGVRVFGDTAIKALLPFETLSLQLFVYNTHGALPTKDTLHFTFNMNGESVVTKDFAITNAPNFVQTIAHPYTIFALGGAAILLALGTGSVLVLRQKR